LRRANPVYRAMPICWNINIRISAACKTPNPSCAALRVCHP